MYLSSLIMKEQLPGMPQQQPHILFIQPSAAPFVTADLEALARQFKVTARLFHFKPFWRQAWDQIAQLMWLLRHLPSADALYIWFADYHSIIPTLIGRFTHKQVVVVLGGYDVARLPQLQYGAHLQPFRSFCSRITLRHASLLLPVSHATALELSAFAPHAPSRVVYNGVDTDFFASKPDSVRDIAVLTVCGARDIRAAAIKGIEVFLDVARLLPRSAFLVIGLQEQALDWVQSLSVPNNVVLQDRVGREDLAAVYARTSVYCQFSQHESFGMALAEAMSSGCLPVVTNTGALPEVTGDAGWIVAGNDAAELAAAVALALQAEPEKRLIPRKRVVECFSQEKRFAALAELIHELMNP
jgi:glycosyltransferase involved in cell wall biosynthesis